MYTALITGASKGIGRALVGWFAKTKINVVLVARDETLLREITEEHASQIQCYVLPVDLAEENSVDCICHYLAENNITVTHLVNNAGFGFRGLFQTCPDDRVLQMLRVNVEALTRLTHALLPGMLKNKFGRIMNVASTAAFQPGPYMAEYYATKAYIKSFSEALSVELKNTGITVTSLCPGATATEFFNRADLNRPNRGSGLFGMATAESVAKTGFIAMQKGKRIAINGFLNRILCFSTFILPNCFLMHAVKKFHGKIN